MPEILKYKYIGKDLSTSESKGVVVKNGDMVEGIPFDKTMNDNTIVKGIDFENDKGKVFIPITRLQLLGSVGVSGNKKISDYFTLKNFIIGASIIGIYFLVIKKTKLI